MTRLHERLRTRAAAAHNRSRPTALAPFTGRSSVARGARPPVCGGQTPGGARPERTPARQCASAASSVTPHILRDAGQTARTPWPERAPAGQSASAASSVAAHTPCGQTPGGARPERVSASQSASDSSFATRTLCGQTPGAPRPERTSAGQRATATPVTATALTAGKPPRGLCPAATPASHQPRNCLP
jgi:hypothetical protein